MKQLDACDYFNYEYELVNQTNILQQLIVLPNPLEFRYYSLEKSCSDNIKTVFIRIKEIPYALDENVYFS